MGLLYLREGCSLERGLETRFRNGGKRGVWQTDGPREAVRSVWLDWLNPFFREGSVYFTGTYSDTYGYQNGLTLQRNVAKDVERFLKRCGCDDAAYVIGVERHQFRDVLHFHGVFGPVGVSLDRDYLAGVWAATRGHCKALPVKDGCLSYVTKYALKGDFDAFYWRLGGECGEGQK